MLRLRLNIHIRYLMRMSLNPSGYKRTVVSNLKAQVGPSNSADFRTILSFTSQNCSRRLVSKRWPYSVGASVSVCLLVVLCIQPLLHFGTLVAPFLSPPPFFDMMWSRVFWRLLTSSSIPNLCTIVHLEGCVWCQVVVKLPSDEVRVEWTPLFIYRSWCNHSQQVPNKFTVRASNSISSSRGVPTHQHRWPG